MSELDRIKELMAGDEPVTWNFLGDSVTAAVWHTWGGRGFPELFHERLRELRRVLDLVINSGVSGWQLKDNAQALGRLCLQHKPDVVIITTGINDTRDREQGIAAFKSLYLDVVARIREETGAAIVIQTPNGTLPTAPDHVVEHLDAYADVVRQVAAETDSLLVDQLRVWQETSEDSTFHWIGHGCHPNAYGQRAMARTLLQHLELWGDESRLPQLLIP